MLKLINSINKNHFSSDSIILFIKNLNLVALIKNKESKTKKYNFFANIFMYLSLGTGVFFSSWTLVILFYKFNISFLLVWIVSIFSCVIFTIIGHILLNKAFLKVNTLETYFSNKKDIQLYKEVVSVLKSEKMENDLYMLSANNMFNNNQKIILKNLIHRLFINVTEDGHVGLLDDLLEFQKFISSSEISLNNLK